MYKTDNSCFRSVDDAFVMYAAISSGLDTVVVSNDFYGTFYAHMPPESRLIYKKWQLSNHVVGTGYLGTHLVSSRSKMTNFSKLQV